MSETIENYQALNQLPIIEFSYNWNKKLDCNVFTTIRVKNENKYQVGNEFDVHLVGKSIKKVKIVAITYFVLKNINEFIAQIDTGYSRAETIKIMERMYGKKVHSPDFIFSIILLKTIK